MSDADRELRTGRLLAATPAEVLAAVTDGARLARWWGPAGFSNQFEIFEPRPGGRWKYEMIGPDGRRYPNEGAFVELTTARVLIHHRSKPVFGLELTLVPETGGTRLGWLQRFETLVPNAELRAFLEQANGQNLDRLEAELARGA